MLMLQLGLCAMGFWWMCAKSVRLGAYELARPGVFFVGLLLFLQAPMIVFLGFAVGASDAVLAAREGQEVDVKRVQKKYRWMDPAVTGGAAAAAGLLAVAFARRPEPSDLEVLEDFAEPVVGVRDFVRERREQEEEQRVRRSTISDRHGNNW